MVWSASSWLAVSRPTGPGSQNNMLKGAKKAQSSWGKPLCQAIILCQVVAPTTFNIAHATLYRLVRLESVVPSRAKSCRRLERRPARHWTGWPLTCSGVILLPAGSYWPTQTPSVLRLLVPIITCSKTDKVTVWWHWAWSTCQGVKANTGY